MNSHQNLFKVLVRIHDHDSHQNPFRISSVLMLDSHHSRSSHLIRIVPRFSSESFQIANQNSSRVFVKISTGFPSIFFFRIFPLFSSDFFQYKYSQKHPSRMYIHFFPGFTSDTTPLILIKNVPGFLPKSLRYSYKIPSRVFIISFLNFQKEPSKVFILILPGFK